MNVADLTLDQRVPSGHAELADGIQRTLGLAICSKLAYSETLRIMLEDPFPYPPLPICKCRHLPYTVQHHGLYEDRPLEAHQRPPEAGAISTSPVHVR